MGEGADGVGVFLAAVPGRGTDDVAVEHAFHICRRVFEGLREESGAVKVLFLAGYGAEDDGRPGLRLCEDTGKLHCDCSGLA